MRDYSDINPLELINKGEIDLLNSSGSYRVDRYPWAYNAWLLQQQSHWMAEEISMGDDIKDWAGKELKDNERNLLMQIFRFFTQSDIEVSNNYLENYIPLFQPLEIKLMMTAFSNMEGIHINAYALLLKTLGIDQSEFNAFSQYSQMQNKVNYWNSFNINTCADVARTLAMFGAFTEGISLFSSFAVLLSFPRFNKMKGMGQIVSFSVKDESLHSNTIITLFHEWTKQTNTLSKSVIDDILDVCKTTVDLEDKFIDLAFEMGDIEGLKATDIKSYIRYIADWRLTQLRLTPIYGYFGIDNFSYKQLLSHPMPWLLQVLNGVEFTNFFEQKPVEYSKATSLGIWHGQESVWNKFDEQKLKKMQQMP